MNITIDWETEEKKILLAEFHDKWSWDEFHTAIRQMHDMAKTVDYRIDIILWHKVDLPPGNPLVHFRSATQHQPDNIDYVIAVNTRFGPTMQRFLQTLTRVVETIYPNKSKIKVVGSFEEARKILAGRETA